MNRKTYLPVLFFFLLGCFLITFPMGCGDSGQSNDGTSNGEPASEEEVIQNEAKAAIADGAEFFNSYCTMCHGEKGKGDGHMADKLDKAPPDLTMIAARRDGIFPEEVIKDIVAGRQKLPGHGDNEMPNWFETLKKSENISDESIIEGKIDHIVAYLASIQQ